MKKVLVMGLSGSGKTALAAALARRLSAVHFNADAVRSNINKDLGFGERDRIEQATRMGWLCDQVVRAGHFAVADFICPTEATRAAFMAGGAGFVVFVDRVVDCRYADTNAMFVRPEQPDVRVDPTGTVDLWAGEIERELLACGTNA